MTTSPIEKGVGRTKRAWFGRVTNIFGRSSIQPEAWDELEEALIGADVGLDLSEELISRTRDRIEKMRGAQPEHLREALTEELVGVALANGAAPPPTHKPTDSPQVILVVGVNGSGKTTTIAKLARREMAENRRVLLVAGDTFRAAAIEQLQIWGERLGAPVVAQQHGADPGAVAFDGIAAAKSRDVDTVIIDTAGRLQTKTSLMDELRKVRRVVERAVDAKDIAVLLVLQVERHGTLIVVRGDVDDAGAAEGGCRSARFAHAAGRLHVDHVGAEVGQEFARPGADPGERDVEHANAIQRLGHDLISSPHPDTHSTCARERRVLGHHTTFGLATSCRVALLRGAHAPPG